MDRNKKYAKREGFLYHLRDDAKEGSSDEESPQKNIPKGRDLLALTAKEELTREFIRFSILLTCWGI